jgi:hypothetical protein
VAFRVDDPDGVVVDVDEQLFSTEGVHQSLLFSKCERTRVDDRLRIGEQNAPSRFARRGSARRSAATQAKQLVEIGRRQPGIDHLDGRRIERRRRTNAAIPAAQDEAATAGVEMECHPDVWPETQLRVSERVDVTAWSDGERIAVDDEDVLLACP